jgi:predicted PurR-regulated permease PerM
LSPPDRYPRSINKEFSVSAVPYRVRPALPPVVDVACILAMLYAGRDILQPIALAAVASLIVAPFIRSLSSLGLGRLPALLASLAIVGAGLAGAAAILATQLVGLSAELPQYHAAIHRKAEQVHAVLERPFARVEASLNILAPPAPAEIRHSLVAPLRDGGQPIPVEVRPARMSAQDTLSHLLSLAWGPIGEASLVLVLLSFILLEHESLQDRLVRLGGHREISRTIAALADATRGVSRFFFCQFVVNCVFGLTVGIALWLAGLPHALLWGALSAMLRFVPYVGALAAGAAIALFAAAVDPGWGLSLSCLALFGALELLVANLVEPKVYGHSTGLSPLAVVSSALFWGSLWGPAGLLISTPLTVCLVVAGRYLPALESLAVLLGEAPSVTAAQRFFQRSLSGDAGAIIRDAGAFLRRASFARYCDHILLPGLALAVAELQRGRIDAAQQQQLRCTVADLAEALVPGAMRAPPGLRSACQPFHARYCQPHSFCVVYASGDAAMRALTPTTASSVLLRQPSAQPSPNAMPRARPVETPTLSTIMLSGPGDKVRTMAAARKARNWSGVSMGGPGRNGNVTVARSIAPVPTRTIMRQGLRRWCTVRSLQYFFII